MFLSQSLAPLPILGCAPCWGYKYMYVPLAKAQDLALKSRNLHWPLNHLSRKSLQPQLGRGKDSGSLARKRWESRAPALGCAEKGILFCVTSGGLQCGCKCCRGAGRSKEHLCFPGRRGFPQQTSASLNMVVCDSGVYHQDKLVHQAEPFVFAFSLPERLISQIGNY